MLLLGTCLSRTTPSILVYPLEQVPPQAGWVRQLQSRRRVAELIDVSPQQAQGPAPIQRTI